MPAAQTGGAALTPALVEEIKAQVRAELAGTLKTAITQEVVRDIINTLSTRFLGETPMMAPGVAAIAVVAEKPKAPEEKH